MQRLLSGIEGLDQLLYGGFPKGRAYLIAGEPGTGKTLFSLQYLLEGLKNGESAVYITIDEKPEHIILDAESLGWDLQPYLKNGQFKIIDVTNYFASTKIGEKQDIKTEQVIYDILNYVKKQNAHRLAIDPIAPVVFNPQNNMNEIVEYIRKLVFAIEENSECTTLITSYIPVGSDKVSPHGIEEFVSSGIIVLKLKKNNQGKNIRTITVRKMRGTRIELSEYSFEILPDRGLVLRQPL